MAETIPESLDKEARKLFRYWKRAFREEYRALRNQFGDGYHTDDDRQLLEVDGDLSDAMNAGRQYVEIASKTADRLRNYAGKLGFRDYNSEMNKGPHISSWEKDGWIVSIPDRPERFRELILEELKES